MSKPTNPLAASVAFLYDLLVFIGNHLQSPLLFVIRFVWGIQLMQAGFGKLLNIEKPIGYFTDLGIPFPVENAWLVGFTETFGGMFLALGLLTRLTAIPLIINFIVAYITTEEEGLKALLNFDTDKFCADTAFPVPRDRRGGPRLRPRRFLGRLSHCAMAQAGMEKHESFSRHAGRMLGWAGIQNGDAPLGSNKTGISVLLPYSV